MREAFSAHTHGVGRVSLNAHDLRQMGIIGDPKGVSTRSTKVRYTNSLIISLSLQVTTTLPVIQAGGARRRSTSSMKADPFEFDTRRNSIHSIEVAEWAPRGSTSTIASNYDDVSSHRVSVPVARPEPKLQTLIEALREDGSTRVSCLACGSVPKGPSARESFLVHRQSDGI